MNRLRLLSSDVNLCIPGGDKKIQQPVACLMNLEKRPTLHLSERERVGTSVQAQVMSLIILPRRLGGLKN